MNEDFQRRDRVAIRRYGFGTVLKVDDNAYMTIRLDSGNTKRNVDPKNVYHVTDRMQNSDSDHSQVDHHRRSRSRRRRHRRHRGKA